MTPPATLPPLGAAIRGEFLLEPGFVTVNHGSFGATSRVVLAAQDEWRRRMEAQPTRFFRSVMPAALRAAADRLAASLGAAGTDLAFVDNATAGCNAVLRSWQFAAGDEILAFDQVYGAVRNTIRHVSERSGARLVTAAIPFPAPTPDAIVAAVAAAITPRTRLAVIDHITSGGAVVVPLAAVIAACHASGVAVLVDGAHGPGQVDLDLAALDADYYVGNCHKWLMAAKGCGFIWARRDRQAGLHPAIISHGYEQGFTAEFDWTGTRDPSAWLSVTAALDFCDRLGGAALRARNAALAAEAAMLVAARLGTQTGTGHGANAPQGAMAMVRLPLAGPADAAAVAALRGALVEAGTDAPVHLHGSAAWLRLSAQAYNERDDYVRLAELAAGVCAQRM